MALGDYIKTIWQNNLTPLSETNLNKIENKLDEIDKEHKQTSKHTGGLIYIYNNFGGAL